MELEIDSQEIVVRLSRRNIESLLTKLNGNPPWSACTIERIFGYGDGTILRVIAEENEKHYGSRLPGIMHPETETAIRKL